MRVANVAVRPAVPDPHLAAASPIRILWANRSAGLGERFIPLHEHPFYQLEVITAGRLALVFDGTAHEMAPGMASFFRPFHSHGLRIGRVGSVSNLHIKFEADAAWVPFLNFHELQHFHHRPRLEALVKQWLKAEPLEKLKAQLGLARLFLDLADDPRYRRLEPSEAWRARPPEWLPRVLDHVCGHLEERITVGVLASVANMSPDHFSRRFRTRMGVSPVFYLQRAKCEKAKELLGKGLSCKQAASQLGFHSVGHFSRAFKRLSGTQPSQWSKRMQELA